jgi:hypothetical protein
VSKKEDSFKEKLGKIALKMFQRWVESQLGKFIENVTVEDLESYARFFGVQMQIWLPTLPSGSV